MSPEINKIAAITLTQLFPEFFGAGLSADIVLDSGFIYDIKPPFFSELIVPENGLS